MRYNRICNMFLASAALTALAAAPAAAQTPYDGLWHVTIVTKAGSCEPSTHSTLTVTDGKVSAAGADVSCSTTLRHASRGAAARSAGSCASGLRLVGAFDHVCFLRR